MSAPSPTVDRLTPRVARYRELWYPDVGNESHNALRGFSVDRILHAIVLDQSAFGVPELELEQHCASACGIIGGKAGKAPVLRFTPKRRGGFR